MPRNVSKFLNERPRTPLRAFNEFDSIGRMMSQPLIRIACSASRKFRVLSSRNYESPRLTTIPTAQSAQMHRQR